MPAQRSEQPMTRKTAKLILWTGEKHSGKTTSVAELAKVACEEGFTVTGLLAESLYENGRLIGFDAVDLRTGTRAALARRTGKDSPFKFVPEGTKLGNKALGPAAAEAADLVIVDEFGPWEMKGRLWRENVDTLVRSNQALILLVVRSELARQVENLYLDVSPLELAALEPESVETVLSILRGQQQEHGIEK